MRASESERVTSCPHSLIVESQLPRTARAMSAANYGTAVHHWKETGEVTDERLAKKLRITGADRFHFWSENPVHHEVTFAVRLTDPPETLWYRGPRDGSDAWKASFGSEFLTGTVDHVMRIPGTSVFHLDDLKTGRFAPDPDCPQMLSYATAVHASVGWGPPWVHRLTITHWPLYPLRGLPTRTAVHVGHDRLEAHLRALRWARDNTETAAPGSHCLFCPGREPHAATPWMQNVHHRALPTCTRGAVSVVVP